MRLQPAEEVDPRLHQPEQAGCAGCERQAPDRVSHRHPGSVQGLPGAQALQAAQAGSCAHPGRLAGPAGPPRGQAAADAACSHQDRGHLAHGQGSQVGTLAMRKNYTASEQGAFKLMPCAISWPVQPKIVGSRVNLRPAHHAALPPEQAPPG